MQLTDVLCYVLLTITMAATCIEAGSKLNDVEIKKLDKRMNRRSSTLLVDTAPSLERMFQPNPKVAYRKMTRKRHAPPVRTYGLRRNKYGPSRPPRKPGKKYRSKNNHKFSSSGFKNRIPKPRYGPPKRQTMKPVYGPPKISPHRLRDNSGFGEPPKSFSYPKSPVKSKGYSRPHFDSYSSKPNFNDFSSRPEFVDDFASKPDTGHNLFSSPAGFGDDLSNKPFEDEFASKPQFTDFQQPIEHFEERPDGSYNFKQGYGEPPVDSYGAPIQPNLHDLTVSSVQSFPTLASHSDNDFNLGQDPRPLKKFRDEKRDNNYAQSNLYSAFSKPDFEIFVTPVPKKHKDEQNLKSYSDIYDLRETHKKKKSSFYDGVKYLNQPWKGEKMKEESNEEIVVGGQYAEPPARYVPKFQPSAPMFSDNENSFSPSLNFAENEDGSSSSISSYVNYKNSNMAFSPQNLNDAFSIVDK